ncbi:MAG: putative ATP-dependent helicase, partial [Chlamydiia bacterium]|nr:putative ATP-dependent helicase [Chlamydiia bacterium]
MFTIDKTKSHSFRTLTIVTETPLPLLIEEEKGYRAREKTLVNAPIHFFRIRPTKSFLLLQTLAATGKLFFDGKQLACDFFSRLKLKYRIDQQEDTRITITPHLFDSRNEWKLIDCDLLLSGSPHIMIKGQILRCIDDDVVWSELQPQLLSMNEYEKWKEDNEYQIELQRAPQKSHIEPHPLLLLTDRTGAFANLLMDYNGLQKPFSSDPLETCYENDLIESGFQKKEVATSQYYCSVDKAFTAIDFLLDVGWRVFDSQKREIMRLTDLHIAVQQEDALRITGSAHFGEEELEITDLIQAMKRKENYIP